MLGSNQSSAQDLTPNEKHDAIMQQLDEIKRYVAGTFSKVDSEIDEIRKAIDKIDAQVREGNQKTGRVDQLEGMLRNIESTVREIQRKVQ